MSNHMQEIADKFLRLGYSALSEGEKRVIQHVAERLRISRNINNDYDSGLSFGQRLADRVASFGGSWTFIILFGATLLGWIILNSVILARRGPFDPYPYILLNLVLSMIAALQAPIIMMSQNRQAAKDRLDAAHDYEVNLKAELEIMSLHEKLDSLREKQWQDLLLLQQEQIGLLLRLVEKQNPTPGSDRRPI
jgi:uncharacterized membrane protein